MNKFFLIGALALLTSIAWAHEGHSHDHKPADTDFKTDICAVCKMAVTSKSYAAQIVNDGKPLFFDDIGCLVQYERKGQIMPEAVKARYVRSVAGDAWLEADKAVWVTTKDVRTPMGYGFHAFADKKSAEAFVKTHKMAQVVAWAEVQKQVPDSMGMGTDSMGKM